MSNQNSSLAGNFESTAQRMVEALDRAGDELSSNVNECIEQLSGYNFGLQKSLNDQLKQVCERFQTFVESNSEELEKNKDTLLQHLEEFGQTQIQTVSSTGQSVRQSLSAYTQQALEKISKRIEEQLEELRTLLDKPENGLSIRAESAVAKLREITDKGKAKIEKTGIDSEDSVSSKSQGFERELQEIVSRGQGSIEAKIRTSQSSFQDSVSTVISELNTIMEQSSAELRQKAEEGNTAVNQSIIAGLAKVDSSFEQWSTEVTEIYQSFMSDLEKQRGDQDLNKSADIEQTIATAKDQLSSISTDAIQKIESSHKTLQSSLKKLEKEYLRNLQSLISGFEASISETSRRSSTASAMQQRLANELLDKLNAQMTTRGTELLKGVRKLSEQYDVEYAKSTQGLQDKIEHIKETSMETFGKQVQSMKSDAEKALRSFNQELLELEADLDQIEEAGKAAAVTVMAYRSAILSLGGEQE